jgi:hypothetical protein
LSIALLVAWIVPLAAGCAIWLALNPARGPGWRAATAGQGCVLGLLLAAAVTAMTARADTLRALAHAGPWLAVLAMLAGGVAWQRMHKWVPVRELPSAAKPNRWLTVLLWLALLSLVWRAWIALREILLRPTYPWDAWDAWAVKSKTWVLLGHYVPFVPMQEWIANPTLDAHTSLAWAYPSTLAWMQVWFASAAGGWIEQLVNLPWFALWVGLLLGHYGQWRALGVARRPALAGMYALGSLPLINVHVALAGYADLWVATVFGFAVLAWLRWLQTRSPLHLVVAAIWALSLPLLKLEGAVWLLLLAATIGFGLLRRRWRRRVGLALLLALVIALMLGHFKIPVPGLGWVEVARVGVDIPGFGRLAFAWHGAALSGVLSSLFTQPNWHLLWWLAPFIVVWRWRELVASEPLRRVGALLCAAIVFLLFLFLLTDAASWAEHYTAVNRLLMHIVPALVTFLVLLLRRVNWREVFRGTAPAFAPRSGPA